MLSSPKFSCDLDLFDETGDDHAKGGSPTTHLIREDARSGSRLLLQHLDHDVKTFLSRGPILVHRTALVHQVREAFLLHRIVDAFHLQQQFSSLTAGQVEDITSFRPSMFSPSSFTVTSSSSRSIGFSANA